MDYEVFDGLELCSEERCVERGRYGLTGWRLLRGGRNELWKQGRPYVLELGSEMLESAVSLQKAKGEKIPIDSRHALYHAARRAGVEEAEALRQVPGGVAALGFGSLEVRDGDLWLTEVEWGALAQEMLDERMLRYYSPVIRGLDGRSPFRSRLLGMMMTTTMTMMTRRNRPIRPVPSAELSIREASVRMLAMSAPYVVQACTMRI